MKVLLVSANPATTPYPIYPLGMGMVAAALAGAGHTVRQFDFLRHGESLESLVGAIDEFSPGLVGISIRNLDSSNSLNVQGYLDNVRRIVERIRRHTRAPVVLGGSAFSILPEEIRLAMGADYGIVGEGERLAVELANLLERGERPAVPILRAEPGLAGPAIPSAAYDPDLIDFYARSGSVASLQTKRGCPHHCIYCSYPVLEGRRIRTRDPAAVADDVEALAARHGVRQIFFTDSVFNDADGHFRDVVGELKRRGLTVPWTAFFRPGGLTDEDVADMCATGLNAAELGSDAASDTTLRALGKEFRFADVLDSSNRFLRHGITVSHYFMFGGPGETPETVLEGIGNIRRLGMTAVFVFMGIRIMPDTPLLDIARRDGCLPEGASLMEPLYYFSPAVDRAWLERTLTEAFAGMRNCVFPPDALDSGLRFLHRLGYSGSLIDLLLKDRSRGKPAHGPAEP